MYQGRVGRVLGRADMEFSGFLMICYGDNHFKSCIFLQFPIIQKYSIIQPKLQFLNIYISSIIILTPGGVDHEDIDGESDADDNDHHPNHHLQHHYHRHIFPFPCSATIKLYDHYTNFHFVWTKRQIM